MIGRLKKIRSILKEINAQGILVTNHKNIFYVCGFKGISPQEREAILVITSRRAVLVVPEMYVSDASKLPAVKNGIVQVLSIDVQKGFFGTALSVCGRSKKQQEKKRIVIESRDLCVWEFKNLRKNKNYSFVQETGLIESIRQIKDHSEIRSLAVATKITDSVFSKTVHYLRKIDFTEITEQALADKMLAWGREEGADDWAFLPIIASGAGSALPHYHTSKRRLRKNAPLLMDFGFRVNGYNSDMSRTIFLGKAPQKFKKYYEIVRSVQEECVNHVCVGVNTSDIDHYARNHFAQSNVVDHFIHSLGHGLGLDVHELPFVGPKNGIGLEEGMVITIEPGLYFPGKYGIRIEDDVAVTKTGRRVLNRSSKELIEVM